METLVIDQTFILNVLRANRDRLRDEFGIERIGLYGSFARNEQTEKSDVDLVYTMAEGRRLSLQHRNDLQDFLCNRLYKNVDLTNQRYMNPFTSYTMRRDVKYV